MIQRACLFLLLFIAIVPASLPAQQSNAGRTPARSAATIARGATGANWPEYGGTTLAWRYSTLAQVNTKNETRLFDLTAVPPVLRTFTPSSVKLRDGSTWQHSSAQERIPIKNWNWFLRSFLRPFGVENSIR